MPASTIVIDFSNDETLPDPDYSGTKEPMRYGSKGGVIGRPARSESKKAIRQRARRKLSRLTPEEQTVLWGKDIEEWDLEELARGRPRASDGTWKGSPPAFMDRRLHEEIVKRFETIVRSEMNQHTVSALQVIGLILEDDHVDAKGKPTTPAGTKLEAAKFLIEHIVGKPKQRTESDISVKLQGMLGHAMIQPTSIDSGQFELSQGFVEVPSWEEDENEPTGE